MTRVMVSKFWNALNYLRVSLNTPWDWPFKVTKVKCNIIGLPIYGFLLMSNSYIWLVLAHLRHLRTVLAHFLPSKSEWPWLWPSKSLKVKCDGDVGFSMYEFLLVVNSNTWLNSADLRNISLQSLSDLDNDLSRSLKPNVIAPMDSPYMLASY